MWDRLASVGVLGKEKRTGSRQTSLGYRLKSHMRVFLFKFSEIATVYLSRRKECEMYSGLVMRKKTTQRASL